MIMDMENDQYKVLADKIQELTYYVGIYSVKVIDRAQKSVYDESLLEESEKNKQALLKEMGIDEKNMIDYFLDERNAIIKEVAKIKKTDVYTHAMNMMSSIDVRIREISQWEHYSNNLMKFFYVTKKFYSDYLTRHFQVPINSALDLNRLARHYRKYSASPKELRKIVREDVPLKKKDLLHFLLEEGKKIANNVGIYLPDDYAHIKLIPVDYTIANGGENTIRINTRIMKEEPLDTAYCIIHEFGHVLREKIIRQLNINPLFKVNYSYSFGTTASEGFCIEFSERMCKKIAEHYPEFGENLLKFHNWYLYYSAVRGQASMNYCLNKWSKKRYMSALKAANGSWSRSKLEWNNLITNIGYKEGYIVGYRKAHGEKAFHNILKNGYVCLTEL